MIRKLLFVLAVVAGLAPLTTSAQAVIPPHINLHNGFIEVKNEIVLNGATASGFTVYFKHNNTIYHSGTVAPGHSLYFNHCCILAGTLYQIELSDRGTAVADVRPQLCNVRGIPFGYAVVVFTGHLSWDPKNHFTSAYEAHVPHVSCPVPPA